MADVKVITELRSAESAYKKFAREKTFSLSRSSLGLSKFSVGTEEQRGNNLTEGQSGLF